MRETERPITEDHVTRAIAATEQRMRAAQRRDRLITGILLLALMVSRASWTALAQAGKKTVEQRVSDLEKRTGGFMQTSDGKTVVTAPFEVVDAKNQVVMRVLSGDSGGLLDVGDPDGGGHVFLGIADSGEGQLQVFGANQKAIAAIGKHQATGNRGFHLFGAKDDILAHLSFADGRPQFTIGDENSGGAKISIGNSGSGFLNLRNESGLIQLHAGRIDKTALGVYLASEGSSILGGRAVSIFGTKLGGNVSVSTARGIPVANFMSHEQGGALVLAGSAGGAPVVDLGVRAGGGSLRVFSEGGGAARAALEADDKTGGVAAYDGSGRPTVTMSSMPGGSGRIQVSNNGVVLVEAGVTTENTGMVRAGPAGCKTVGALAQPCRIVGNR